jgi:hypothetical protein
MQRCDLTKLNNAEVKEHTQVKISNRFAALDNLDDKGLEKHCRVNQHFNQRQSRSL